MKKWFQIGIIPVVIVWMFFSLLLLICAFYFRLNDYVNHPQHELFANFNVVSKYIQDSGTLFWYRAYFVLDFIWAFFFLTIIGYIVSKINYEKVIALKRFSFSLLQLFMLFAIFAYLFDVAEGIGYLLFWGKSLPFFVKGKMICYAICLGFFAYYILKKYVFTDFRSIYRFIQTSILSIVFIALVYVLLTVMPQGGTLIVDLFYNPVNIILLFTLLTFLAIIISHFPVYVDIWLHGGGKAVKLVMTKRWIRFLGFGIIYYSTFIKSKTSPYSGKETKDCISKEDPQEELIVTQNTQHVARGNFSNKRVASLRRSLGILLYIAVFNIFLGVASRFYEADLNVVGITVLSLILCLIIYHGKGMEYTQWKDILSSTDSTKAQQKEVIIAVSKYVSRFPKYFVFCLVMVALTTLVVWKYEWSKISLWIFFITLGFQTFLYTYFKICRSYFKYVFYSDSLWEYNCEMFNPRTLELFKAFNPKPNTKDSWYLKQYGKLSDNVKYLTIMQISGVSSFFMLIAANLSFVFASMLNPLIIILLYIIFFYSAIIITFKHVLYYHRTHKALPKYRELFRYGIPVITMFIMGWMVYSSTLPNDLHELRVLPREQPQLSTANYLINRTKNIPRGEKENFFFVGSYGGGLKANLWNLLLFNELDRYTDNGFRKNTLVMSGVSGGAVGIANYASLIREIDNYQDRKQAIYNIGTSNVLSNELVYLMGADWIREYLPFSHNGRDRSYKSMQNHAFHTGMGDRYNQISYSDYWRQIYAKEQGEFPVLLMNTTSTTGRQGVASTVDLWSNTFPAANIITDFGSDCANCDLTFFGAVSTTNRFPLFSPSAEIPGKGNYVDGGYFENSGMLSTLELYETLAKQGGVYSDKIQPVFVNIINSQDYYIANKVLNEWGFTKASQAETGELSAILSTIISIDKLPRYVFDKIEKKGYVIEAIMMPHKMSYEKVTAIIRGDVDDPIALMRQIKLHNDTIDQVLKRYPDYNYSRWGVVTPPLARILSVPAVRYQEAMVALHPEVKRAIERIDNYLRTDTIVDDNYKRILEQRIKNQNKSYNLDNKKQ